MGTGRFCARASCGTISGPPRSAPRSPSASGLIASSSLPAIRSFRDSPRRRSHGFATVRQGEHAYLEKEALDGAVKWAVFIQDNLSDLDGLLIGNPISASDQRVFDIASNTGDVFRYKVFGPDGLIVFASRANDVGKTNIKPYFSDLVKKGRTFVKIENEEDFGDDRSVVSEAYVPIMKHDRFRGAIEVYVDMTGRAIGLPRRRPRSLSP